MVGHHHRGPVERFGELAAQPGAVPPMDQQGVHRRQAPRPARIGGVWVVHADGGVVGQVACTGVHRPVPVRQPAHRLPRKARIIDPQAKVRSRACSRAIARPPSRLRRRRRSGCCADRPCDASRPVLNPSRIRRTRDSRRSARSARRRSLRGCAASDQRSAQAPQCRLPGSPPRSPTPSEPQGSRTRRGDRRGSAAYWRSLPARASTSTTRPGSNTLFSILPLQFT